MKREQIEKIIEALTERYSELVKSGLNGTTEVQEITERLEYWHKKNNRPRLF